MSKPLEISSLEEIENIRRTCDRGLELVSDTGAFEFLDLFTHIKDIAIRIKSTETDNETD